MDHRKPEFTSPASRFGQCRNVRDSPKRCRTLGRPRRYAPPSAQGRGRQQATGSPAFRRSGAGRWLDHDGTRHHRLEPEGEGKRSSVGLTISKRSAPAAVWFVAAPRSREAPSPGLSLTIEGRMRCGCAWPRRRAQSEGLPGCRRRAPTRPVLDRGVAAGGPGGGLPSSLAASAKQAESALAIGRDSR